MPKQDNGYDCGVFVLAYIEYFVAGAPCAVRLAKRWKVEPRDLESAPAAYFPRARPTPVGCAPDPSC